VCAQRIFACAEISAFSVFVKDDWAWDRKWKIANQQNGRGVGKCLRMRVIFFAIILLLDAVPGNRPVYEALSITS